jgi:glycosyltransferase involved in cell wall biosynthesis
MSLDKKTISVLIPSLNEQNGIKKTISSIPSHTLQNLGYGVEIIVIDGGSTDLTREIALEMGAKVIVERRKGYGRAYKTAFKNAKGDFLVTLDADGTYPAENIPSYVKKLDENDLDFITINRFGELENGAMSLVHKIGNKILSFSMRVLYAVNVRDSQSGMWIMRRSFVEKIRLNSDDMSLSEEIKIIAFKYFKSIEIDGNYFKRVGDAKLDTVLHGWRNLRYLFEFVDNAKLAILPTVADAEPLPPIQKQVV